MKNNYTKILEAELDKAKYNLTTDEVNLIVKLVDKALQNQRKEKIKEVKDKVRDIVSPIGGGGVPGGQFYEGVNFIIEKLENL